MKLFFSHLALTLCLVFLASIPARAESPVTIILYQEDAKAPNGFKPRYHWLMNRTDEWRRFEYLTSQMPEGKEDDINPYLKKPKELLIATVKDDNGVTGKDYYLSKDGIMVTSVLTVNSYFVDEGQFMNLLRQELSKRSTFERYPGDRIPTDSKGVLVRYRINESLPNPAWLVNTQKDVNLYDGLMRNLKPQRGANRLSNNRVFDEKGHFILLLNYPKAPAKFATIGAEGVRLSRISSSNEFRQDQKKYFDFFRKLTSESARMQTQVEAEDQEKKERGNF